MWLMYLQDTVGLCWKLNKIYQQASWKLQLILEKFGVESFFSSFFLFLQLSGFIDFLIIFIGLVSVLGLFPFGFLGLRDHVIGGSTPFSWRIRQLHSFINNFNWLWIHHWLVRAYFDALSLPFTNLGWLRFLGLNFPFRFDILNNVWDFLLVVLFDRVSWFLLTLEWDCEVYVTVYLFIFQSVQVFAYDLAIPLEESIGKKCILGWFTIWSFLLLRDGLVLRTFDWSYSFLCLFKETEGCLCIDAAWDRFDLVTLSNGRVVVDSLGVGCEHAL